MYYQDVYCLYELEFLSKPKQRRTDSSRENRNNDKPVNGTAELLLLYEANNIDELFLYEPIKECCMNWSDADRGHFTKFGVLENGEVVHISFQPNWVMYRADSLFSADYKNKRQVFCIYKSVTGKILFIIDQWFANSITTASICVENANIKYEFFDLMIRREGKDGRSK